MDEATVATIAGVIKTIVDVGPTVIQTVEDAIPFAEKLVAALSGKQPTEDDLAQLEAEIDALSERIQAPLPPEEE